MTNWRKYWELFEDGILDIKDIPKDEMLSSNKDRVIKEAVEGDLIYSALKKGGLRRPLHSTRIYFNLSNDKEYDQIMFFPGHTKQNFTGNMGIFDFDEALFPYLWQTRTEKQFRSFLRYYISDHLILWAEFKI